jgi:hypothetical protein
MGNTPLIKLFGAVALLAIGLIFGLSLPVVSVVTPQVALGFALKIMGAVIATIVLFATLRLWDTLIGINFKANFNALSQAHATYFAARIIGLCLLFAALLFA